MSRSMIRWGECHDREKDRSGNYAKKTEPRCLFTHCYGHALILACSDSVKKSKLMKDMLATAYEITKLVKLSPKRESQLTSISESQCSEEPSPRIRLLCPTRWTLRAITLKSIIQNYDNLRELWVWSIDNCKETEMIARLQGVKHQMDTYEFFFNLHLGKIIFSHCDNLSKTLQSESLSTNQGQLIATMTVNALESIRNDECFELFWEKVQTEAVSKGVSAAALPRRRKAPARFEQGIAAAEFPESVEDFYRHYFEVLDLIISTIKDRFENNGVYHTYCKSQTLVITAAMGNQFETSDDFNHVCTFFGSDFDPYLLKTQLNIFAVHFQTTTSNTAPNFSDILEYLRALDTSQITLISEVVRLVKLLIVMPAINATSERSFSCLRRVKTYLRNTMAQQRLNHLMILNCHKERLDKLGLNFIANDFVDKSESV